MRRSYTAATAACLSTSCTRSILAGSKISFRTNSPSFHAMEEHVIIHVHGRPYETPQNVFMRVALATNLSDKTRIIRTYNLLSNGMALHSVDTMRAAGTTYAALSNDYCTDLNVCSMEAFSGSIQDIMVMRSRGARVGISMHNIPIERSVSHNKIVHKFVSILTTSTAILLCQRRLP